MAFYDEYAYDEYTSSRNPFAMASAVLGSSSSVLFVPFLRCFYGKSVCYFCLPVKKRNEPAASSRKSRTGLLRFQPGNGTDYVGLLSDTPAAAIKE